MTDRATISETFDRLETEAGGVTAPGADARIICERVATELGIDYEDVRAVMVEIWTGGAG